MRGAKGLVIIWSMFLVFSLTLFSLSMRDLGRTVAGLETPIKQAISAESGEAILSHLIGLEAMAASLLEKKADKKLTDLLVKVRRISLGLRQAIANGDQREVNHLRSEVAGLPMLAESVWWRFYCTGSVIITIIGFVAAVFFSILLLVGMTTPNNPDPKEPSCIRWPE